MKKIAAGKFKAQCLSLMDRVQRTRQPLLITKRGKPVVKLVPVIEEDDGWFGRLKGEMEIVGDIESPIYPAEAWKVLR